MMRERKRRGRVCVRGMKKKWYELENNTYAGAKIGNDKEGGKSQDVYVIAKSSSEKKQFKNKQ